MNNSIIALSAFAALCLAGCTTTGGVPTITPTAQASTSKVLSDAQIALTVGDIVVAASEGTGEISGTTATQVNAVMADLQAILTAAQAGDAAATATTVQAKIAAAQTALTAIQTAAPQDAKLIATFQAILTAFSAVETSLPAS